MGKNKKTECYTLSVAYRSKLISHYTHKYAEMFENKYKLKGLTPEENRHIFWKFWEDGKIAQWNYGGNDEVKVIVYTGFTQNKRTIYGTPSSLTPVFSGDGTIEGKPATSTGEELEVGKKCTCCYIRKDHLSIREMVEPLIMNVVDAEMVLKTNEFAMKMPLLFRVNPENEIKMRNLIGKIANDEPAISITGTEADSIEGLITGISNQLAELYTYKMQRENEIKTFLGFDNTQQEDYSRLNVDQTNANNAEVQSSNDITLEILKEWNEESKKVFGVDLQPEARVKPVTSIHEDIHDEGDEDDEEN